MNPPVIANRRVVQSAFQGATYNSPEHAAIIESSRQRSRNFGLTAQEQPDYSSTGRGQLQTFLEENRLLFQHAAPVMETLYEQIANTQSMILLTARSGMVLHSLGDLDFLEKTSQIALAPGMDWSEQSKGTNAIGTALAEGQPMVVHGDQHYLKAHHFLTCSCTPIIDPHGNVVGALDVTGDYRSYHQHTMALARMSAQMIENHMFADVFPKEVRVHFHTRSEFLGTMVEGIVVFTGEGRFLAANRSAQFQFGMSINALQAHTFSSLFDVSMSQFQDRVRASAGQPVVLCLHNGVTVCCKSAVPFSSSFMQGLMQPSAPVFVSERPPAPAEKATLSGLKYLDTGDPQVAAVIQKLRRVQGRDIPVMILGETGTGKDLLAQAIHQDSVRARQTFVSLNCASIPENLIEAELFGYEEGAFTGARRKGSPGKIQQAHGGTLFLDEIGDMPLHLQARLLRVLQERKVNPLGAGKEVAVDLMVICATHKDLKKMIASGTFREDLYYRLNGLVVKLPALRDRQDLDTVIRKILVSVNTGSRPVGLSPQVMALLRAYAWPGNFRQLFNLLRTAVAMASDESEICIEHLPDDFLEEVQGLELLPVHSAVVSPVGESVPVHLPPMAQWVVPVTNDAPKALESVTLDAMAQALRSFKGNISLAAKALGVSRNTIYRKKDQLPPDIWA